MTFFLWTLFAITFGPMIGRFLVFVIFLLLGIETAETINEQASRKSPAVDREELDNQRQSW